MDPELALSKHLLEQSIDSLSWWLEFWTALVVIGLIVEYVPEFIPRLKRLDRLSLQPRIGGAMITIGVAMELYVGIKASAAETKLREVTNSIVASLNKEAADASREGELARLSASTYSERISLANERAAIANKEPGTSCTPKQQANSVILIRAC